MNSHANIDVEFCSRCVSACLFPVQFDHERIGLDPHKMSHLLAKFRRGGPAQPTPPQPALKDDLVHLYEVITLLVGAVRHLQDRVESLESNGRNASSSSSHMPID